jgi:hypothetical protein
MPQIEDISESVDIEGSPPVEGYRALSVSAMVALVLGLFSGIAVFSPLLGIVPLVAMTIGGYSLWRISANSDRLSGRWMALAPFVLGPLFLGWGLSREFSRRERLFGYSREFAEDCFEIMNRKEAYLAHQLKVSGQKRLDMNLNMEIAYKRNEPAGNELKLYLEGSPVKEILEAAPNVKFQFEEFCHHRHEGFIDTLTLQYTYVTPTSSKTRFWIVVQRTYDIYENRIDWQVMNISLQKPHGG